jgi:hypothetical protein
VLSTVPITAPSFDETARICTIVAVVDTRSVLQVCETTPRGVYYRVCQTIEGNKAIYGHLELHRPVLPPEKHRIF